MLHSLVSKNGAIETHIRVSTTNGWISTGGRGKAHLRAHWQGIS